MLKPNGSETSASLAKGVLLKICQQSSEWEIPVARKDTKLGGSLIVPKQHRSNANTELTC